MLLGMKCSVRVQLVSRGNHILPFWIKCASMRHGGCGTCNSAYGKSTAISRGSDHIDRVRVRVEFGVVSSLD